MKYLDRWIEKKIGIKERTLTREKLKSYQLKKLKYTVDYVKENSFFYRQKIENNIVNSFEDFEKLPFTLPEELMKNGEEMICVPSREISRIVTLETSGTTGRKKRIFFTKKDQELTIDFFAIGMQYLLNKDDKLLILMPYERPDSVGDLLRVGVERIGAKVYCLGVIKNSFSYNAIVDTIVAEGINSIVGMPTQVHDLMKYNKSLKMKNVLLSAEYVSPNVVKDIKKNWCCEVFEHYGMTEMGRGGAVSCKELKGYHVREADLYFEIINPQTGSIVPDGEWGEVVFTTLTREAMPLVRYRTGDMSRIIKEPCHCGSMLKRLDKVRERNYQKGWL